MLCDEVLLELVGVICVSLHSGIDFLMTYELGKSPGMLMY